MRCQEAYEAISAALDGELAADERPALRRHLTGCDPCRRRQGELQAINLQLRTLRTATPLAARAGAALRARIQDGCAAAPAAPSRWPFFTLGMALTGASAMGALLVLALRPAHPAGDGISAADNAANEVAAARSGAPAAGTQLAHAAGPAAGTQQAHAAGTQLAHAAPAQSGPGAPAAGVPAAIAAAGPAPASGRAVSVAAAGGPGGAPVAVPDMPDVVRALPAAVGSPRGLIRGRVSAAGRAGDEAATFTAGSVLPPPEPVPAPVAPGLTLAATPEPAAAPPACAQVAPPAVVMLDVPPQAASGLPPVRAALDRCGLVGRVVALQAGQTLVLANQDQEAHALALHDPAGVVVRRALAAGEALEQRLLRPGSYQLVCDGGGQPCGHVMVVEHPHFALTDADGRFQIPTAPAGTQRVTAWRPGFAPESFTIEVPADRAAPDLAMTLRPAAALAVLAAAEPSPRGSGGQGHNDCRLARQGLSPVGRACAYGGRREAKRAMKAMIKAARGRGLRYECDTCHRDEHTWALTDDARARFSDMLAATGT